MEEPEFNKVCALFGTRGVGKTPFVIGDKDHGIPGLISIYLQKGMKVLIVDTLDHPKYRKFTTLSIDMLNRFKKGVARIFARPDMVQIINKKIEETIWNTFIVYEDAGKHQRGSLDDTIMQIIGDSKAKNNDILFMYHSWGQAPKDLYRYVELIEVFKTRDHPKCRKDDMPGYYDDAVKIYDEVHKHPSRFFHKLLDTGI